MQSLTITAPDDWHIHLRDGDALARTVGDAASQFKRAIIMPNLVPPVMNAEQALNYKQRIQAHIPEGAHFEPLMVLYLTDNTTVNDIAVAKAAGVVACKLYPAGATTNSDSGVTNITRLYPVLEAMAKHDVKLLIHGEVTDNHIDIFDREALFLERTLTPLIQSVSGLKIVLEHITTANAVDFVNAADSHLAATITAHHLLFNRNHMLAGGIRPHFYCLPILKRGEHQNALISAATSGSPKFFLGTDSAPHTTDKKEAACGCAGAYTANAALSLYAQAFEEANALDKLEGFASHFGPDYYGLARNSSTITLIKQPWQNPETLSLGKSSLTPLLAGQTLNWAVQA
ncbi:dihydroorotase [Marinagarivorans algicola]|uniref:dihydroorotase n=1 Tax=Marinagarivorans algicola TaxID=1513270 RepID=UPI0006B577D9|nr:dihydroorotase [Marinagarivorans algicola]